jgi:hypothetical protein
MNLYPYYFLKNAWKIRVIQLITLLLLKLYLVLLLSVNVKSNIRYQSEKTFYNGYNNL